MCGKDADVGSNPLTVKDYDEAIKMLEKRIVSLKRSRDNLIEPEEPVDGSVVKFKVQYEGAGPAYQYAALRMGNTWYTTSADGKRYTWRQLVRLMRKDYSVHMGIVPLSFTLAPPIVFTPVTHHG